MEDSRDSKLFTSITTPTMNSIEEEDIAHTPVEQSRELRTPFLDNQNNQSFTDLFLTAKGVRTDSQTRASFMSPSANGLYSSKEGNNSSSSLIYNSNFSFGENNNTTTNIINTPNGKSSAKIQATTLRDQRRNSWKYIPGNKLGPPPRNRSPVRNTTPDVLPTSKRSSVILESPFNFTDSFNEPPKPYPISPHKSTPPSSAGSRTAFRKGHSYKHSSVSMNFFQEPEVKIPLNIAKSLPIPDFNDIFQNLPWPKAHSQLFIVTLQIILGITTFQVGYSKSWSNFITLSHFITYDIIGSVVIILVEALSQFEVWFTGTITFPFGLNRIDVLFSFALAVSLCFVGLDLLFHILEEVIVVFVESAESDNHDDIVSQIPHSHHDYASGQLISDNNMSLWYIILALNLMLATFSLYKTFYANTNSKLKTKNPIITIIYIFYLFTFPYLSNSLSSISDYIATFLIAIFILTHGLTIAEWTSTILLLGFSTTTLPNYTFLLDQNNSSQDIKEVSIQNERKNGSNKLKKAFSVRQRSVSSLPVAISSRTNNNGKSTIASFLSLFKVDAYSKSNFSNPTNIKSIIKENIENLPEFKSRCNLDYNDLVIIKANFNIFVVLMKINLKGGSNDDELSLRLAVDKCLMKILPNSETTIEIDRI